MNLQESIQKVESHARGVMAEIKVQQTLWKYGYSVQKATVANVVRTEMSMGRTTVPYDFFVDNKTRLEVKSSKLYTKKKYRGRWVFQTDDNEADVFAFVFWYPDGYCVIRYAKHDNLFAGKKKGLIPTFSFRSPDDPMLRKSPYDVFGKPLIHTKTHEGA